MSSPTVRSRAGNDDGNKDMTKKSTLDKLTVGDYVTACGADSRGHTVTRTGTLLAPPKAVTAQRSGTRVKGVRLCVGLEGTNPKERSTWTTLFPDSGSVELARKPTPDDWTNGPVGFVPGVRITGASVLVRFGGKGGKRSAEPSKPVVARISYGVGCYEIRDAASGELLLSTAHQSAIWWAPAPDDAGTPEPAAAEQDVPPQEAEPATRARPQRGVLYEGWLSTDDEPGFGRAVLHLTSGRVIGWLTPEQQFRPAA
ncbi:hypothetical protein IPZ58_05240 [Streptomyces roseoverticillatus]|uniref:hypothetical protein n=1 Tax=Streptomyces roseoverticillatus TaxID=66429 RepID=UPI001F45A02B|nr:hypothetical protein [Streptomyces roseoverticillatus]MCF3100979.1 hypothetical protein [Streptomyces roseoverticillatus]